MYIYIYLHFTSLLYFVPLILPNIIVSELELKVRSLQSVRLAKLHWPSVCKYRDFPCSEANLAHTSSKMMDWTRYVLRPSRGKMAGWPWNRPGLVVAVLQKALSKSFDLSIGRELNKLLLTKYYSKALTIHIYIMLSKNAQKLCSFCVNFLYFFFRNLSLNKKYYFLKLEFFLLKCGS